MECSKAVHLFSNFFMPNRLANEKSLYLRQHANNPVDWYPWGKEALDEAQNQDKLLLISIGYSACHWCHVMAHESFENEYIAQLMNAHFICVKIDREEHPELDNIYMESIQMITGQGGWPLNIFCLPDGRPFTGGTYFPPDESRGMNRVPWPQILLRVSEHYRNQKEELFENADNILKNLERLNHPAKALELDQNKENTNTADENANKQKQCLVDAVTKICANHDDVWGGFGQAPKFPPSMTLNFLMAIRISAIVDKENSSMAKQIDQVVNITLTRMAYGGLFDQIGGGFSRYSVDRFWQIPHFEKMLYDNALLIHTYTKAWLHYQEPLYKAIVEETIHWLKREMGLPDGGTYASIDADTDGEEGQTYLWTPDQIASVLDEKEAKDFCKAYGISEQGNFENGHSHPRFEGKDFTHRQAFTSARNQLLDIRNQRSQPIKDKKQLISWNSLLISALAEAGFTFGQKDWLLLAQKTADWIWENCRCSNHQLNAVAYDNISELMGCLDDYAFYIDALLTLAGKIDWVAAGKSSIYIERAEAMTEVLLQQFSDKKEEAGFYFTSQNHKQLIHRSKIWFDNALPTGNSSLLNVFSNLYALTGKSLYQQQFDQLSSVYPSIIEKIPQGMPHGLEALASYLVGIAVIKIRKNAPIDALQKALTQGPWRKVFICTTDDTSQNKNYQLCIGTQCLEPTDNAEAVAKRL